MAYVPGAVTKDTMLISVRKDQKRTLVHNRAGSVLLIQDTTKVGVEDILILDIVEEVAEDILLEDRALVLE